jgi:predicted permease
VFHAAEEQIGQPLRKVVIGHAFWTRHFERRPAAVGAEIVLNGDTFVVVGVAPEGYQGTTVVAPDLWVPISAHARAMPTPETLRARQSVSFLMGARLKAGISIAQAQADLDGVMRQLAAEFPDVYARRGLAAAPLSRVPGEMHDFVAPFVGVLMGMVGLVLLVACTNLAGLLLSRATHRSREIAVRLALGAPRRAIVGLLMTETMLVFAFGALAGGLAAALISRLLAASLVALPVPVALDLAPDWRVLVFAAGVAIVTGVLTGLAPALQSLRPSLTHELRKDAGATPRRQRLRRTFIAAQIAFSVVLVVAAGLFLRALAAATAVDPGFQVRGIEVATVDFALGGYDDSRVPAVADEFRRRLAVIPGVDAVGIAAMVPLSGGGLGLGGLRRPGAADPADFIDADWNVVSPQLLSAIDLPLRSGRHFTDADREGAPLVAIVNERFAARVWPGENPIGQTLENGDFRPGRESMRRLTVVGVARDSKYRWLGDAPRHFVYVPLAQNPMRTLHYFLHAADGRAAGAALAPAVRSALRSLDPNLPLIHFAPLASYADLGLLPQRLAASVAGSLGMVALLLSAIGVYGVTAFAVASRTREIGLRMALGADRRRVLREVVRQGLRVTAVGAAVGFAGALAVTQLLTSLLFGVSPSDPVTFTAAAVGLGVVAAGATYLPARRAARIDPVTALRAE